MRHLVALMRYHREAGGHFTLGTPRGLLGGIGVMAVDFLDVEGPAAVRLHRHLEGRCKAAGHRMHVAEERGAKYQQMPLAGEAPYESARRPSRHGPTDEAMSPLRRRMIEDRRSPSLRGRPNITARALL
jgi:hypothetical protein